MFASSVASRALGRALFLGVFVACLALAVPAFAQPINLIPVGCTDVVYDTAHGAVLLSTGTGITRYDLRSKTELPGWGPLGGRLGAMDLSLDGKTLAVADQVANGNTIAFYLVDTESGASRTATISTGDYFADQGVYSIAWCADGSLVVVPGIAGLAWLPAYRFDPATGACTVVGQVGNETALSRTGDGSAIAMPWAGATTNTWGWYSPVTRTLAFMDNVAPYRTFSVSPNRDGSLVAIPTAMATRVARRDTSIVGDIPGSAVSAVMHPTKSTVYVQPSAQATVSAYDASTLVRRESFALASAKPLNPVSAYGRGRMRMSDDGRLLFAILDNRVQYIFTERALSEPDFPGWPIDEWTMFGESGTDKGVETRLPNPDGTTRGLYALTASAGDVVMARSSKGAFAMRLFGPQATSVATATPLQVASAGGFIWYKVPASAAPATYTVSFETSAGASPVTDTVFAWRSRNEIAWWPATPEYTRPLAGAWSYYGATLLDRHRPSLLGVSVPHASYTIYASKDAKTWSVLQKVPRTTVGGVIGGGTDEHGNARLTYEPSTRMWYRICVADSIAEGTTATRTADFLVYPKVNLGRVTAPSRVRAGAVFSAYGTVFPAHVKGSQVAVIQAQRKTSSTTWSTIVQTRAYASTSTQYRGAVVLKTKGTWRVRCYHPTDNLNMANCTGWKTITVY